MTVHLIRWLTILSTAVALAAGLAHLLALPNKIHLSGDDYFTVQQIYAGWNRLGLAVALALLGSASLTLLLRHQAGFGLALTATILTGLALGIFFIWIFPANQATHNWTQRPSNWEALRTQWEYGHATGAFLYFTALACLAWSR